MSTRSMVRVGTWSNPRVLVDDGAKLHLMLAHGNCLCGICLSRVNHVNHTLSAKKVEFDLGGTPEGHIFLVVDKPTGKVCPKKHLAGLIDLDVVEA